jgi:hypothetical protein
LAQLAVGVVGVAVDDVRGRQPSPTLCHCGVLSDSSNSQQRFEHNPRLWFFSPTLLLCT